jgi:5-formyltetrahydrofolate cyclo-ligase
MHLQTTPNPQKQLLRREGRRRRAGLGAPWREEASRAIAQRVLHLPEVETARAISLYASFGSEVCTHWLIGQLLARHKTVVLPVVLHGQHRLELRAIDSFPEGFAPGDFGILEPLPLHHPEVVDVDALDLILVPGILFSRLGYRLGYGGGYYDRLLAEAHHAPAIGLAFSPLVIEHIPPDPWDRPVDAICTEKERLQIRAL